MLNDNQIQSFKTKLEDVHEVFEGRPISERRLKVYVEFLSKGLPNLRDKTEHFAALMAACDCCIAKGSSFPLIRDIAYEWVPMPFRQNQVQL